MENAENAENKTTKFLTVAEKNADFETMLPYQKRVAIARDVIERLDSKEFLAKTGSYAISIQYLRDNYNCRYLATDNTKCAVCAIGAAAASVFDGKMAHESVYGIDMVEALSSIFPDYMLRAMEYVFEGSTHSYRWYKDKYNNAPRLPYSPYQYAEKHSADTKMRHIYQYIIDNSGEFDIVDFLNQHHTASPGPTGVTANS